MHEGDGFIIINIIIIITIIIIVIIIIIIIIVKIFLTGFLILRLYHTLRPFYHVIFDAKKLLCTVSPFKICPSRDLSISDFTTF